MNVRRRRIRLMASVLVLFYLYQQTKTVSNYLRQAQGYLSFHEATQENTNNTRHNSRHQRKKAESSNYPQSTFGESKVSQLSLGADMFENVCLVVHSGGKTVLYSSSERLYRRVIHPLNDKHWRWTTQTATTRDWNEIVQTSIIVKEETLLVLNLFGNPGHCWNDLAFSMAMHDEHRTNTTVFPHFVYIHISRRTNGIVTPHSHAMASSCTEDANEQDRAGWSYCCRLMQSLGFIREGTIIVPPIVPHNQTSVCFQNLIIPRYAQHRIPSTQAQLDGISRLRQRMFDTMIPLLNSTPWQRTITGSSVPTIFFQDRGDPKPTRLNATFVTNRPQRRMLQLSKMIQDQLMATHHVLVHRIRKNFTQDHGAATFVEQQAHLYNAQQYILEVHGASLANVFFTRPGTRVFEIQCAVPNSATTASFGSDNWKWYSSVAPYIGLDYHQYLEYDGCLDPKTNKLREDYSPPLIRISNVTLLVQLVAQHFGLTKRQ